MLTARLTRSESHLMARLFEAYQRRDGFMQISRRAVLGAAGLAGAAAATGAGLDRLLPDGTSDFRTEKVDPMVDDAARFGDPRLPSETITSQSHLFHLSAQKPTVLDGGSFQQADEDSFPILKGQEASILSLTLQ